MEDRRTTAIELDVSADADRLLQETAAQFGHCANATTEWCWAGDGGHTVARVADAERRLFRRFRRETELPANLVQKAVRRGVEAVKSSVARLNDGGRPDRPRVAAGVAVYDGRDAALNRGSVSLATTSGRVSCGYARPSDTGSTARTHAAEQLADEKWEFRGGHLERRGGDWYLHAATRSVAPASSGSASPEADAEHGTVLGVELGGENVAVASTGTFWSTDEWSAERATPEEGDQSPSGGVPRATNGAFGDGANEHGRAELYLHRVGNELVAEAVEHGCSHVVFEDVARGSGTEAAASEGGTAESEGGAAVGAKDAAALRLLRRYVERKAAEHGVGVARVASAHPAHRCSTCGFEHEDNHDGARFECLECGFENHAAYNASKNIGASYRRRQRNAAETTASVAGQ